MTQKQVGAERFYLAYASTLLFNTEGCQEKKFKQGRNLEAGADTELEGVLLARLVHKTYSASFLNEPKAKHQRCHHLPWTRHSPIE